MADDFDAAEPRDPKEVAQYKVDMALRDAILATADLVKLRVDPIAGPYVVKCERELWQAKTSLDLLISEIKETSKPKLKVV